MEKDLKEAYVKEAMARAEAKRRKKRRRRIINAVLYTLAGALIVVGAIIVLRDQTLVFSPSSAEAPKETFPPVSYDPSRTPSPYATPDPSDPAYTHIPGGNGAIPTDDTGHNGTQEPVETEPSGSGGGGGGHSSTPIDPSQPVSVHFVDKGINVSVYAVGYTASGGMATVGSATKAGWFKYSSFPNQDGNCIIAGHNRYKGQKGLFSVVKQLQPGDRIIVEMASGEAAFYFVQSVDEYPYQEVPGHVMQLGGERRLTLITCKGDYDSGQHTSRTRVVAICVPAV